MLKFLRRPLCLYLNWMTKMTKDMKKIKIEIPTRASQVIDAIQASGYEAFVVGGCVRDSVMGKIPHDWDITTNALPEDIVNIFPRTIPTGIQHGTVTVLIDDEAFEVTTYRLDGDYLDMRRPRSVSYSQNLEDDLFRRDFTINAMAYNDQVGLVDKFGGLDDIEKKLVRCVGNPDKRFNEDALRILRALRFSAKLFFDIEGETMDSIRRNSVNIEKVSMERINTEFEGIIRANTNKLSLINDLDIRSYLFGDFCFDEEDLTRAMILEDIDSHEEYLQAAKRAMIFSHYEGDLKALLKFFKYSKKDMEKTLFIWNALRDHMYEDLLNENATRDDLRLTIKYILRDAKDNILAKYAIYAKIIEKYANIGLIFNLFNDIIETGECFSVSHLQISGRDIIDEGLARGKEVGILLENLLCHVISQPQLNEKERLLEMARKIQKQ